MTRAKKSFGQHFLRDRLVARRMVASARVAPRSTVVEVGPGRGALTREIIRTLPEGSTLILVEADRDLLPLLEQEFLEAKVVRADAAILHLASLGLRKRWTLLGNLPYNAASAILMNALRTTPPAARMVVMVQKEVASRILAHPGGMSLLSLAVQLYSRPRRLFDVSPSAFRPKPKVESTVLLLEPYQDRDVQAIESVMRLAKCGFSSRRKQLHRNLSAAGIASSREVKSALRNLGLPEASRAQELSVNHWRKLARSLSHL